MNDEKEYYQITEFNSQEALESNNVYLYPNKLNTGDLFYLIELEEKFKFGLIANDYGSQLKIDRLDYDKYFICESDTFYVIDLENEDIYNLTTDMFILDYYTYDDFILIIKDRGIFCYEINDFDLIWEIEIDDFINQYYFDDFQFFFNLDENDDYSVIDIIEGKIIG